MVARRLRELQRRAPPSTEGCWLSKVTVRGRGVLDDLETTDCGAPARQGSKDVTPLLETSLMLGRREQADGACVEDDDGRVRAQLWVLEHSQLAAVGEMALTRRQPRSTGGIPCGRLRASPSRALVKP